LPPIAAEIVATGDLVATRAKNRPNVVVPEQPVGGAPHVHHILGMRPDAAADTEHHLNEQGRLDVAVLEEVRRRMEMAHVVALDLEARAVVADQMDRGALCRERPPLPQGSGAGPALERLTAGATNPVWQTAASNRYLRSQSLSMKPVLVALAVPVLTMLGGTAALSYGRDASAVELQQETRAVAGFHRIEINGQANVTLVQGTAEGVTIEAPPSSLARIRTAVRNETLVVEVAQARSIWQWFSGRGTSRTPHITIRLRDVDRIEAAGAVTLDADSLKSNDLRLDLAGACTLKFRDLQAMTLRIDGSGAIKIDIAGKVARQRVDLSGAGSYQAERLVSEDAVVEVSGAGKAVVNASNSLAVDISGAGRVEYLGDPKLKQSISGIGKITRRKSS
jgi:hypothetical protein